MSLKSAEFYHLRTITNQIISSNETVLPAQVPSIVSLLYSSLILEDAFLASSNKGEESTVLLNKFKARVSSLLQSKAGQARWAGVALAKASIESSNQCLSNYAKTWVPLMVNLLGRPESPHIHALSLNTLCNVFNNLTIGKPALSREITSPNLKPFLDHIFSFLLSSTHSDSSLSLHPQTLPPYLKAILQTLIAHAITFRPYATKAHQLALSLLSLPPYTVTPKVEQLARQIFVNLHLCTTPSKIQVSGGSSSERINTSTAISQEWTNALKAVIHDTHDVLDVCFRAIKEPYSSSVENMARSKRENGGNSKIGLTPWKGLDEGIPRILLLMRLLKTFFSQQTGTQVSVPAGMIVGLLSRCFNVIPPIADLKKRSKGDGGIQTNPVIDKQEREALWAHLAEIHEAGLTVLETFIRRIRVLSIPLTLTLLEQIIWVFENQSCNASIRTTSYSLLTHIIPLCGLSLPKTLTHSLHPIISKCCDDLLPPAIPIVTSTAADSVSKSAPNPKTKAKNINKSKGTHGADSFFPLLKTGINGTQGTLGAGRFQGVIFAAAKFLPYTLAYLPTSYIKSELRTKIDRTGILTQNRELILTSVLYPPGYTKASLLPFLMPRFGDMQTSRELSQDLAIEGVVWPRMPVIKIGGKEEESEGGSEEDEQVQLEQDMGNMSPKAPEQQAEHFPAQITTHHNPFMPSISPQSLERASSTALSLEKDGFIRSHTSPTPRLLSGPAPPSSSPEEKDTPGEPRPKRQKTENSTETQTIVKSLSPLSLIVPPPNISSALTEESQPHKEKGNGEDDDDNSGDSPMVIPDIDITMDTESDESGSEEQ